ncbi:MAG: helix-turn-helix domain-containing protein [Lachnospiraceae bacterium]|nr:helix-turn-helix domain-containing protein [Lachnospiraceae bacterium]
MDRIKIGKFIAKCRKDKSLTQEQLAEILNITNKSVSKWENGSCLPDASLYEPLCSILNISINELFAGQRIQEEDYKRIADDNLLQMLKYKLYSSSDKSITFDEFDNALSRVAELTTILKAFNTKKEAVDFLMKETNGSLEECSGAYDFYVNLFKI